MTRTTAPSSAFDDLVEPSEPASCPASLAPRYVLDFVEKYLTEGERLRRGGAEPAAPPMQLIAIFSPLRDYLLAHSEALGARGVVSAEIEAGEVLVQRLSALLQPEGGSGAGGDACEQAAAKLRQIHDTLRLILRSPETVSLRARLGLDRPLKAHSLTALLRGIDQLLTVFQEQPAQLLSLRLIPADIQELEALRRRLLELRRTPSSSVDPAVMQRVRLALDSFFASMAAAISASFPAEDPRCVTGLRLIPRLADRHRTRLPLRPWRASYPSTDE